MERFFYQNNIVSFLADSDNAILGALAKNNTFDLVDLQRKPKIHYRENPQAYVIEKKTVTAADTLPITMAPGGGFAISFDEK